MKIYEDIKSIKGIGEKTAGYLNKLGVFSSYDLLNYFPRTYVKYEDPVKLDPENCGKLSSYRLFVKDNFKWKKIRNLSIGTGYLSDGKNTVSVTFFNVPYYKGKLVSGASYIFRGKVSLENGRYKMEQPKIYTEAEYHELLKGLWPVYRLTKGLSNKVVSRSVERCAYENDLISTYKEYLPEDAVKRFGLCPPGEAIIGIHFPKDEEHIRSCRKRLSFDELITFLCMIRSYSGKNNAEKSDHVMIETALVPRVMEKLPYDLTEDQLSALKDIVSDMTGGFVMNRLIQGDVGSGKTIIAFLSMLLCADNGYQSAMMAPTELLSAMHFNNLKALIEDNHIDIRIALLTGQTSAKERKEVLEGLKDGSIRMIIGTHALFQNKVEFKDLALVITDEQHRFGVKQRQMLSQKSTSPHILAMSATPIPRTLSIVLFRDMSLSVIKHKPSSRRPVKNCVVDTTYRPKAYQFIASEIKKGHQAYVICPLVESTDGLENVENVTDYAEKLKKELPPEIRIEYLHGKMKDSVKNEIMDNFAKGNTDVLVSTTVIEVGIDVPNSTVIMIENSERFGLAQLHQLRGRIGRGKDQSYSIFIDSSDKPEDNKRLQILNETNDGFLIAEEDLKIRGAGDVFGIRQSGFIPFDIADIYEDHDLIVSINDYLDEICTNEGISSDPKYSGIIEHINENMHKFIDFKTI